MSIVDNSVGDVVVVGGGAVYVYASSDAVLSVADGAVSVAEVVGVVNGDVCFFLLHRSQIQASVARVPRTVAASPLAISMYMFSAAFFGGSSLTNSRMIVRGVTVTVTVVVVGDGVVGAAVVVVLIVVTVVFLFL